MLRPRKGYNHSSDQPFCMEQVPTPFVMAESIALVDSISELLISELCVSSLEMLHEQYLPDRFTKGTDQASMVHKIIYEDFDRGSQSKLLTPYYSLCKSWLHFLQEKFSIEDWGIQSFPSIRVHFPGNVSVFEFHRDSDYNHPLGEINHFLAVTKCTQTAALWYEKHLGWEDYRPLELKKYQSAMINTSIYKHGDKINAENYSRISLDFRAIPAEDLIRQPKTQSLTKGLRMELGSYFRSSAEFKHV